MAEKRSAGTASVKMRCTSINEAGVGTNTVTVSFTQVQGAAGTPYGATTLNLLQTVEEASGFFPGQTYDLNLTPTA